MKTITVMYVVTENKIEIDRFSDTYLEIVPIDRFVCIVGSENSMHYPIDRIIKISATCDKES